MEKIMNKDVFKFFSNLIGLITTPAIVYALTLAPDDFLTQKQLIFLIWINLSSHITSTLSDKK